MGDAAKRKKVAILGGILLFIILLFVVFVPAIGLVEHHFKPLPILGPREADYRTVNGNEVVDTIYHKVPDFEFIDQDGQPFGTKDIEGKIVIADFMFTTCKTWCPIMMGEMKRLDWKLEDSAFDDVVFLSHTVDPENDSPEVLADYARKEKLDTRRWTLLTGEKKDLYAHGVYGYFLTAGKDTLGLGHGEDLQAKKDSVLKDYGFLHSDLFVLVDRDRHIRGYYSGLKATEVDRLSDDLKMLLKEEKIKAKRAAE